MTTKILLVAAVALATGAPVAAATLDERTLPGSDFSDVFDRPTVIGADVQTVLGGQQFTLMGTDSDYLMFEGFADGVERLDFRITNPLGGWGGFNLRFKDSPFTSAHDWWPLVGHVEVSRVIDGAPQEFSFDLSGITGPLYLAFDFFSADFTSGSGVRYEITQVGGGGTRGPEIMPSAIPLPPAGGLMLAGLGLLGLMRIRKRRG
ncbi:hypothetical protein [Rhodobaculum claviforme]|uniref:VPLPA-CTERM protein sorting domain-containing protein n=1 Tax=Rhodobaculum claviforme TaxID=1549854 RepID=A0A934TKC8_9RHOB|nr:hypothetical protein [Rhodobaculum claviforme]MBK5926817.1 hypothetical protein [Rhodobaculum claviforme]